MHSPLANQNQELRTNQLHLTQALPFLEIYPAHRSKTEKGLMQLKLERITFCSEIHKVGSDELMGLWLADQIYAVMKDEKLANEAIQVADKNINPMRKRNK